MNVPWLDDEDINERNDNYTASHKVGHHKFWSQLSTDLF